MDARQKKIIKNMFFWLLTIISIGVFIVGVIGSNPANKLLDNFPQELAIIFTAISPATILGIWIKLILNKKHLKEIDNKVVHYGLSKVPVSYETKPNKKDTLIKETENVDYYQTPKGNIIIINKFELSNAEMRAHLLNDFSYITDFLKQEKTPN